MGSQSSLRTLFQTVFQAPASVPGILLILAIVYTLVQRLSINGWGSLVWFAMTFLMVIIRRPFSNATASVRVSKAHNVRVEKFLVGVMWFCFLFLPLIQTLTPALRAFDYELPTWAPFASLITAIPGMVMLYRSHADLGMNFSQTTEIREGHKLVTSGVYKRVRHPMYTAFFLLWMSQPLQLHNLLSGWGVLVFFTLMYSIRVFTEEAMMMEQFGEEYKKYCQRTGRLLPRMMKVEHGE